MWTFLFTFSGAKFECGMTRYLFRSGMRRNSVEQKDFLSSYDRIPIEEIYIYNLLYEV